MQVDVLTDEAQLWRISVAFLAFRAQELSSDRKHDVSFALERTISKGGNIPAFLPLNFRFGQLLFPVHTNNCHTAIPTEMFSSSGLQKCGRNCVAICVKGKWM
jgi:hypothetical protein